MAKKCEQSGGLRVQAYDGLRLEDCESKPISIDAILSYDPKRARNLLHMRQQLGTMSDEDAGSVGYTFDGYVYCELASGEMWVVSFGDIFAAVHAMAQERKAVRAKP